MDVSKRLAKLIACNLFNFIDFVTQLEKALESSESTRLAESRSIRNVDRTVKDLQTQIERRDKQNTSVADESQQVSRQDIKSPRYHR